MGVENGSLFDKVVAVFSGMAFAPFKNSLSAASAKKRDHRRSNHY
jgi:hypothetical protein